MLFIGLTLSELDILHNGSSRTDYRKHAAGGTLGVIVNHRFYGLVGEKSFPPTFTFIIIRMHFSDISKCIVLILSAMDR